MRCKKLHAYKEIYRTICIKNMQRVKWIDRDLYNYRCIEIEDMDYGAWNKYYDIGLKPLLSRWDR